MIMSTNTFKSNSDGNDMSTKLCMSKCKVLQNWITNEDFDGIWLNLQIQTIEVWIKKKTIWIEFDMITNLSSF